MPRVGRKASSLILFALMSLASIVTALGTVAAQDEQAPAGGEAPQGINRILTIGALEDGCPDECLWDTPLLAVRPGDNVSIRVDLTLAQFPHNLALGPQGEPAPFESISYVPPNRDNTATVQASNMVQYVNFTVPADFSEPVEYICLVHPVSMVGELVLPEDFSTGAAGGEPIHHMGVHFLAYWVGLIAFAILFIVYGIAFFLFKYNETSATTDQWDRTGAGAPEVKNKMSSGNATLLAIVIGIVALAAIIYLARMG